MPRVKKAVCPLVSNISINESTILNFNNYDLNSKFYLNFQRAVWPGQNYSSERQIGTYYVDYTKLKIIAHRLTLRPIRLLYTTVGIWIPAIWIPTIWIQELFENQTFWSLDLKWFGIQMAGLWAMSYVLDQSFENWTST